MNTIVNLNVLPLGLYDWLIGMDWLEKHRAVVEFYNKSFTCIENDVNTKMVQGIQKAVKFRQVSTMKLKEC